MRIAITSWAICSEAQFDMPSFWRFGDQGPKCAKKAKEANFASNVSKLQQQVWRSAVWGGSQFTSMLAASASEFASDLLPKAGEVRRANSICGSDLQLGLSQPCALRMLSINILWHPTQRTYVNMHDQSNLQYWWYDQNISDITRSFLRPWSVPHPWVHWLLPAQLIIPAYQEQQLILTFRSWELAKFWAIGLGGRVWQVWSALRAAF